MHQVSAEVLTAVSVTIRVFWEVTEVFCPEDGGTTILKTSGNTRPVTQRNIPNDLIR
jgi:hypothetical protein